MSIRPVDLQVLVQKSGEIHRMNDNNQRQDLNTQAFADVMKKEVKLDDQQVRNLNKSEQEKINKDGKGNASYDKQEKEKEDEKKEKGKDALKEAPRHTGMFDMSI